MSPKSLLRHKLAVSSLEEMANGEFQHLIGDANADAKQVKRVVLCSGKVYYDLLEDQQKRGKTDVALVRVEQLYPFPRTRLAAELAKYSKASEVVVSGRTAKPRCLVPDPAPFGACLLCKPTNLGYAGRPRSPSPAVGHMADHLRELQQLLDDAFTNPVAGDTAAD